MNKFFQLTFLSMIFNTIVVVELANASGKPPAEKPQSQNTEISPEWIAFENEFFPAISANNWDKLASLRKSHPDFFRHGAFLYSLGYNRERGEKEARENWMTKNRGKFIEDFSLAFNTGDVEKLNTLKESLDLFNLSNLDDLGAIFHRYGAGTYKWDELIADARMNKK